MIIYLLTRPTALPYLSHTLPYHFDVFLHFSRLVSKHLHLVLGIILSSRFTAGKLRFLT